MKSSTEIAALQQRKLKLEARSTNIASEVERLLAIDNLSDGQSDDLRDQIHAAEKAKVELDEVRASLKNDVLARGRVSGYSEGPTLMRQVDPWEADGSDSRSRARAALDSMVQRDGMNEADAERVETIVKAEDGGIDADLIVVGSNPSYRSAFRKMLRDPNHGHLAFTPDEQHAFADAQMFVSRSIQTGNTGAYLIPTQLDPTIQLTNTGAANPFRSIARTVTLSNAAVWHGVTSAGATGEWTSEASEVTDATPTFTQPAITPMKGDVYVEASWEAAQDSNLDQQLMVVFQDAKDRLEATAFATGSGSGQPKGAVTALANVTNSRVAATTNAAFGAVDLFAMVNALPARYQDNAEWAGHWFMENLVRQFTTASSPQAGNFWTDLGGGTPPHLLGAPWHRASTILNAGGTTGLSNTTSSVDNLLVLADWPQLYTIVDRIGATIMRNDWVVGTNRRPAGVTGWIFWWRTGGDATNVDAGRVLQI